MESPYFYIIIFVLVSKWEMGIGMNQELCIVDRLLITTYTLNTVSFVQLAAKRNVIPLGASNVYLEGNENVTCFVMCSTNNGTAILYNQIKDF